jgi:hydroxyacylglutathione hydrolase
LWKLGESDFVAAILSTHPPLPKYYPRMKELNAEGSVSLIPIPGGEALSPNQVDELAKQEDVVILDLRRPEAFGGAHIPNAINMGAGLNLSLWAAWLLDGNQRIILVNDGGDDVESRRALVRVGLDRIEGYLDGGFPAWIDAGLEFSRTLQVSIQEVAARPDEVLLLDVRSDDEWRTGHIQGAKHEMLGDLPHVMERLDRRRPVITVCGSGYRSSIAASLLERKGWSDVKSMDGGMGAWTRRALPMVRE